MTINAPITLSRIEITAPVTFGMIGPQGPNAVTSATTSNGTATLSLAGITIAAFTSGHVVTVTTGGAFTTTSRSGIDTRSTFPPASHTHTASDITDFAAAVASTAPQAHTHGNMSNAGAIGVTADLAVVTGASGVLTTQSRSGIDSRTTFPNDDVTAATESATPGTLVRRGILNAQIQVEGLESTGAFGVIGADQTITTKTQFAFNKSSVFLTLDASPTVNRAINFPDEDGTLALKVSTAINEKIEMQGGGESGFVAPNYYAFAANSASLRDGNTGLACLTWGASGAQNLTVPSGTALTFDNTSFAYGTGSASAHRTALGLTALATITPGLGVETALAIAANAAGGFVTDAGTVANATNADYATTAGNAASANEISLSGVMGLGTNVATFLATPSSANLAAAVTDETGSGSLVFSSFVGDMGRIGNAADVSITGAVTLTASAFGQMHVCTGTAADYTVTLPSPSGNAGRMIGFRMSNALTRFVTLSTPTGLIDGVPTRIMWAQETCVLYCDGTDWTKISGKSRPLFASGENGAGVSCLNSTVTPISLATNIRDNSTRMVDTVSSTSVFRIRRAGNYSISALVTYERAGSFAGFEAYAMALINSLSANATSPSMLAVTPTNINTAGTSTFAHVQLANIRQLALSDYVALAGFQSTGGTMTTRTVDVVRPHLSIIESPTW